MFINPFQVRLRTNEEAQGFESGLVGTVVGVVPSPVNGKVVEVWKVVWFNYNEETGEISESVDSPAPSSHLPQELVGFVDRFDNEDEYEDDEEEDDYENSEPLQASLT